MSQVTTHVEDTHIRWLYYITHITAQNVCPAPYCTVTIPVVVVCVFLPVSRPLWYKVWFHSALSFSLLPLLSLVPPTYLSLYACLFHPPCPPLCFPTAPRWGSTAGYSCNQWAGRWEGSMTEQPPPRTVRLCLCALINYLWEGGEKGGGLFNLLCNVRKTWIS